MKKKLTINTLAFGNLTKHKKQYTIMIIGIILAMVFSSSVIISIFSLNASELEMGRNSIGTQDVIMLNVTEKGMKEAKNDGYIDEYGFAHMMGYASTDAENIENGFYIAWLDDTAKKLSYQSFIEGTYPANENEIAIEQTVLARLGIEAKIGEEISLDVFPQNGISHIKNSNQKTYKLVGIVKDKVSGTERTTADQFARNIPSAFVCEGAKTDAGGKESLVSYLTFADFEYDEKVYSEEADAYVSNNEYSAFRKYINEKYDIPEDIDVTENQEFMIIDTNYRWPDFDIGSTRQLIILAGIVGVVLSLTSCIAIINSFNSNIKERRQQIGMLRAVGTTRRQIIKILGREALIISLISIPISLAISYLLVLALSYVFGKDFVLTIDVKSIVICGAVGLVTVMVASLIPIIHATRITPMQAIRNVEISRKMKIKKIKTQKSFSVPKLLAKRSMAFHKGTQISVSILLVTTILFSCLGFSFVSHEYSYSHDYGFDYMIGNIYFSGSFMNSPDGDDGISEADKQSISSIQYTSKAYGIKECSINILIDEYTDYFKIFVDTDPVFEDNGYSEMTGQEYAELTKSDFSDYYKNIKSQAGYEKDFLPTTLLAIDDWKLEKLKDHLVSGSINLDKLASGEEIILVAPQKASLLYYDHGYSIALDDEVKDNIEYSLCGECKYKAGDTIDLSLLFGDSDDHSYSDDESEIVYNLDRVDKKVKIGAVISPNYFKYSDEDQWMMMGAEFAALTSIAGMNKFAPQEKYHEIYMYVDAEITDEIDETVTSAVNSVLYKYDMGVYSNYERTKSNEQSDNSLIIAMVSLIVIGFAICASLTNNAFTASIRERKRELGTLRAVGISRKEFVESYVRQLLKTFGLGYSLGFGIFTLGYLICHVVVYFNNLKPENIAHPSEVGIDFNPWITIAFCIVFFAICSIHLWLKIRKEMKNSIIDNIREL